MEAAIPVAETIASAAESSTAASTVASTEAAAAPSSSNTSASPIPSPATPTPYPSSSSNIPLTVDETKNIPNIPIQNPTSSTIPARFSDNRAVPPPASQRGTTFTVDTSKPPPPIPRGTTFASNSSSPMSGIRNYFNQTAQSNTNSSNDSGKSSSANGLLSNLLLGPRLTLNPTINIGNSSQNQHTISSAGSPHP